MTKSKFIVVHSGNRDYYKVAEAFKKHDLLDGLVSDDYRFRQYFGKGILPKLKVHTSLVALLLNIFGRFFSRFRFLNYNKDVFLSKKASKISQKRKSNLFAYSYYGYEAFINADEKCTKYLFQLHPHPAYVRKLFLDEISLLPSSKISLGQEHELSYTPKELERLNMESKLADYVFCASSFTKMTLLHDGVDPSKIFVVPYGVDTSKFLYHDRVPFTGERINVLFVGSINQRKGVYYLGQAILELQQEGIDIALTIVGRGISDSTLLPHELNKLTIRENIPFSELLQEYHNNDVFIFPSLCEGFGHVILEAMATGLPVITTQNTGGPDIITNGQDGFIIDIRSVDQIKQKLKFILSNPTELRAMGYRAHLKSKYFTWENFQKKLILNIQEARI